MIVIGFVAGAPSSTEVLVTHWSSLDARLEHDIHSRVKASFESSMGQLGIVGATAMDDFLLKMQEVFKEIISSLSVRGTPLGNDELSACRGGCASFDGQICTWVIGFCRYWLGGSDSVQRQGVSCLVR